MSVRWAALGAIPLALLLCDAALAEQTESEQRPIKLLNAVQGPCAKGELNADGGCVTPPHIKKRASPRYPTKARRGNVQGSVVLGATVEVDGTVGPVEVVKSTNPGNGFEEAAIEAVKKWRYKPGLLRGEPVRVYFEVTIDFAFK